MTQESLTTKALDELMDGIELSHIYDIIDEVQPQPYKTYEKFTFGTGELKTVHTPQSDWFWRTFSQGPVTRKLKEDITPEERAKMYVRITRMYKTVQLIHDREKYWGVVTAEAWLARERTPTTWQKAEEPNDD